MSDAEGPNISAPDVRSGLPPVGELVQITSDDVQVLAHWDGQRYNVLHPELGAYSLLSQWVTEWRRLLVLPDDEVVDRMAARHWGSYLAGGRSWEQWQAYARQHPDRADRYRALVSGDAAALREAAIR